MACQPEVLFSEQLQHCKELSKQHPHTDVVSKALSSAEKAVAQLKRCESEGVMSPSIDAIQTYYQSVLDSTYHQECRLVERGFPDDITKNGITAIIGITWL